MVNAKSYTPSQILADIADIRGQIAHMQQNFQGGNAVFSGNVQVGFGLEVFAETQLIPSFAFEGYAICALTDGSPVTVTQATATRLTNSYTIPANDAKTNTIYRLSAWGNGSQGSTAQGITFSLFGFNSQQASAAYASSFCSITAGFGWMVRGIFQATTPGSSGSAQYTLDMDIKQNSGTAVPTYGHNDAITVNTTVSTNAYIMAAWASTTGAPTITCSGSMLERIGP
jgi:hypothetical protein